MNLSLDTIFPMKITKLRHQLYIFQSVILILFLLFLGVTYNSYQEQYKKDIDTYIKNETNKYKKEILSSINSATQKLKKQKEYFTSIHKDTLNILKKDPTLDLEKLKNNIKSKYLLPHMNVELFLIDKSYKIYKTTYPKDLGFDLSIITEAKNYLDKTTKDEKIYISDFVSTDALDMKYKLYSYSKLNDGVYLELGFVDNTLTNTMESFLNINRQSKTKVRLYNVSKDDKQYYYYEMKKRDEIKSKNSYYQTIKKFPLDKATDDKIINSIKTASPTQFKKNNKHIVYTNVFNKDMFPILGFKDIVMNLEIDVSDKLKFIDNNKQFFIASLIIFLILLIILIFIIKNKFTSPIEKILKAIKSSEKIEDKIILSMDNELSEISLNYNDLYDRLNEEIKRNKQLTLIDPLTKVFNRKAYDATMEDVISVYNRYKTPFSLILFDIDNFKQINDNYGHIIGDNVLKELVDLVKLNIRDTDTLYRIGGEEFTIICKNTKKQDAITTAEKLKDIVEKSLNTINNKVITVSIGVTEVVKSDNEDSIYKRVDDHLYYSKNNGKNMVTSDLV